MRNRSGKEDGESGYDLNNVCLIEDEGGRHMMRALHCFLIQSE